jgi:hypothetical protein
MTWEGRIRATFGHAGQLPADEVILELAQHARAMYDAARADGLSSDDADRRVTAQLDAWRRDAARLRHKPGRPPAVEPPAASSSIWLAGLVQDLRYATRLLRRRARFSLLASLTMALGIGATTVLFSVTYGVLMKPLPWPHADRLVLLRETRGGNPPRFNSFSNAAYFAWRDDATTIDSIAAWSQRIARSQTATILGGDGPSAYENPGFRRLLENTVYWVADETRMLASGPA